MMKSFKQAVSDNQPLQILGVPNAYTAIMAEKIGFKALYLSGAAVANIAHGLPDLAVTNLSDVVIELDRLVAATDLPILVDIDTGWGNALSIVRCVRELERHGAAALHIEDQVSSKRCGHRPGKQIISTHAMCVRIKAAVDARKDPNFVIMARSDALQHEAIDAVIARFQAYIAAGADMVFAEAVTELADYQALCRALSVPLLANITEFGKTPLFTCQQLHAAGVAMVLYPLTLSRMMHAAAQSAMQALLTNGSQADFVAQMQTRATLYDFLNYEQQETYLESFKGEELHGQV